ncbi:MAG: hypothetical protein ACJAUC_004411, partial [Planctomycetota bacterium]
MGALWCRDFPATLAVEQASHLHDFERDSVQIRAQQLGALVDVVFLGNALDLVA